MADSYLISGSVWLADFFPWEMLSVATSSLTDSRVAGIGEHETSQGFQHHPLRLEMNWS